MFLMLAYFFGNREALKHDVKVPGWLFVLMGDIILIQLIIHLITQGA